MNVNEECFACRVLEKAENLNPRECHIFDYLLRNMSQDNVICLVPKEDFQRLHISRAEYHKVINNLEIKNYICKIPREIIDGYTPREVAYFMINPNKGFKQKENTRIYEVYKIIRKSRDIDMIAEINTDTYHILSNVINLKIADGNKKYMTFDVNSVI